MKARAVYGFIAWLLSFCLAMPAVAQSGTQSSSTAPQPASSDPASTAPASQQSTDSASQPSAATDDPTNPSTPPGVKTGSKNDVDAIGNRNVGGRGIGDWYSTDTEIKMGKQYAMMVEQTARLVQDPVINEYVNRIGQNLVRNSDAKVPFTIKVIDSDEINAFALPGGFFYVNSGLILAADEEAELAGVMAHEIAHVAARHADAADDARAVRQHGDDSSDLCGKLGRVRSSQHGHQPGAAADVHEVLSQLRELRLTTWACSTCTRPGTTRRRLSHSSRRSRRRKRRSPGMLARAFASHPPNTGPHHEDAGRD